MAELGFEPRPPDLQLSAPSCPPASLTWGQSLFLSGLFPSPEIDEMGHCTLGTFAVDNEKFLDLFSPWVSNFFF